MVLKIINFILLILGVLTAITFMAITYDGFQQKFILKHFSIKNIKNQNSQTTLFLKFGLYFAIFSIALNSIRIISSLFNRLKPIQLTVQRILLNSYDYFIIFALLLFYLLRNKTGWNAKVKVPLFGFWFISSRIIYAVGYILTTLTGLNFKVAGVALVYGVLGLMISEALGFSGFKMFKHALPYIPQL